MITKLKTVTTAAIIAALAIPSVAVPAFARDNHAPAWDACYSLAVERGSGPGKGGGDKVLSQYNRFMDECMAGKIPFSTDANASVVKSSARARAR